MAELCIADSEVLGDGKFDCTQFFAKAFAKPGVRVVVSEGVWLTGPITMPSDSELVIEENAVLRFIDNDSLYTPVRSRWEGVRCWCMHPLIYAENKENVHISGKGTIDCSGKRWWDLFRDKMKRNAEPETEIEKELARLNPGNKQQPSGGGGRNTQFLRPPAIQFNRCRNVSLKDVSIVDSPFWTVHPVFSDNVLIENIKITNPADSPNTDAIDIDSCSNVKITGCTISVGDDGIAVKCGTGEDGVDAAVPSRNVEVSNCIVYSAHGGAVIGSETAANVSDVRFENCYFENTDRGIRIKTRRGRGGTVENLEFRNIKINGCLCPVTFNMYYRCGTDEDWPFSLEPLPVTRTTPHIRNIKIENINATDCRSSAGFIVGLPESRIEGISIKNSCFRLSSNPADTDLSEMFRGPEHTQSRGIRIENAEVFFENTDVLSDNGERYE